MRGPIDPGGETPEPSTQFLIGGGALLLGLAFRKMRGGRDLA